MLYLKQGTLLKQVVPWDKEKYLYTVFWTIFKNQTTLLSWNASLKIFIETTLHDIGTWNTKKYDISPNGAFKTFTNSCLVIKMINVQFTGNSKKA